MPHTKQQGSGEVCLATSPGHLQCAAASHKQSVTWPNALLKIRVCAHVSVHVMRTCHWCVFKKTAEQASSHGTSQCMHHHVTIHASVPCTSACQNDTYRYRLHAWPTPRRPKLQHQDHVFMLAWDDWVAFDESQPINHGTFCADDHGRSLVACSAKTQTVLPDQYLDATFK